ncbi:hypothetical protein PR202_gb11874 [Eleusine coracana subsp. coracana]|uniref:Uncharacterized protein n=1 Tax=Eleusine coracana subsp. coracana TaxID=191504 RepID=A0AAV5EMT4_ELECO|nr:hypothetical protein PR202_gb11874 [Eleusine coracana subsp. coracana]
MSMAVQQYGVQATRFTNSHVRGARAHPRGGRRRRAQPSGRSAARSGLASYSHDLHAEGISWRGSEGRGSHRRWPATTRGGRGNSDKVHATVPREREAVVRSISFAVVRGRSASRNSSRGKARAGFPSARWGGFGGGSLFSSNSGEGTAQGREGVRGERGGVLARRFAKKEGTESWPRQSSVRRRRPWRPKQGTGSVFRRGEEGELWLIRPASPPHPSPFFRSDFLLLASALPSVLLLLSLSPPFPPHRLAVSPPYPHLVAVPLTPSSSTHRHPASTAPRTAGPRRAELRTMESAEIEDAQAAAAAAEQVISTRGGSVLGKKTILKSDHFPGCQNKRLSPQIDGAPNYRQVRIRRLSFLVSLFSLPRTDQSSLCLPCYWDDAGLQVPLLHTAAGIDYPIPSAAGIPFPA